MRTTARLTAALLAAAALSGCAGQLDHLGRPPPLSDIDQSDRALPEARVVAMPMPDRPPEASREGSDRASLWQPGSRGFFRDQRAKNVGDILTVMIDIKDQAQMKNETKRSRGAEESAGIPGLFGFEGRLDRVLPDAVNPGRLVDLSSGSSSEGKGSVNRNEKISLKVAAVVQQRLPNGNLVIAGRQEVRVNNELRELRVAGVIRPEDIAPNNAIGYDKIAEARISYGGRGHITDVQQPRWGQQVLDVIMPF